jgi:hypothetical protein
MNTRNALRFIRCMCILFFIPSSTVYAENSTTVDANDTVVSTPTNVSPVKKQKHRRSRKQGTVGKLVSSRYISFKNMDYDQLSIRIPELLKEGNTRIATKYLKRMKTLCVDPDVAADITMQIGDLLFQRGKYVKAVRLFSTFSLTFPGNSIHAETAGWRAVESGSKCLNDPDRCQQPTHSTIVLADAYLSRSVFTAHRKEVEATRSQCYDLLVQSEMGVWFQCLARNNTQGAEAHLAYVETELSKVYPPAILLAQAYKQEHHPDLADPAQTLLVVEGNKKGHMADRF